MRSVMPRAAVSQAELSVSLLVRSERLAAITTTGEALSSCLGASEPLYDHSEFAEGPSSHAEQLGYSDCHRNRGHY